MKTVRVFACTDGTQAGERPDGAVGIVGLCGDPGLLAEYGAHDAQAVLVLHEDQYDLSAVQTAVRSVGADPLGTQIVHHGDEDQAGRLAVVVAGAAARASAYPGSEPEHAKPVFPRTITRRALLRRPAMEYVAVPLIDTELCAADRGCRVCTMACPQDALRWAGGRIHFDKGACEPCGLCVAACPVGAVNNPAVAPSAIEAQVRALLDAADGPVGVAFTCRRGRDADLPDGWYGIDVPCTGMVPGTWPAAGLLLGASAAAILPCAASGCPLGHDARAEGAVAFARALLAEAGIAPDRVTGAPIGSPAAFDISLPVEDPFGARGPAEVALALAVAACEGCLEAVEHTASPLGAVHVDRATCTLCAQCADSCPTGALAFDFADGAVSLSFDPVLCTACERCVTVCPERARGAISVTPVVDVDALAAGRQTLNQGTTATCESCGKPVAPVQMMARLTELLGDDHAATAGYLARRCPDCRSL